MSKGERYIQASFVIDQQHNALHYQDGPNTEEQSLPVETERYSIAPFEGKFIGRCTQVAYSVTSEERERNGLTDDNIFILVKTPIDPFEYPSTDEKFFDPHHFDGLERIPLRVSSACLPGSIGDLECNCHVESIGYIEEIAERGGGVFVYMPQEAQGRGLREKVRDHRLIFGVDDNGHKIPPMSESEALNKLHPEGYDIRQYHVLKDVFAALGLDKMEYEILGNNEQKRLELINQTGLVIERRNDQAERVIN